MILLADASVDEQVAKATKQAVKSTLNLVEDKMGQAFLWSTVAVVGLILLGALAVYFVKREKLAQYGKTALLLAVGFAVGVGVTGLALTLIKYDIRGSLVPTISYPLAATVAAALAGGFALYIVNILAKDKFKLALWIVAALVLVPLIVALVYIGIYFASDVRGDGYYDGTSSANVSTSALVGSAVGLVVLAAVVALFCGRKGDKREHTRSIAYAGVSVALAFALSYVRLFRMPQGGSITLASMLPIMLYSIKYGPRKGLLVGMVYGVLQALQDPYIIHPAQFLLDYPLAFAMLGLAGWVGHFKFFNKYPLVGLLVGSVSAFFMRYIAHVLSGIFAFSAYAGDAGFDNATLYSFLYNTYVLVDGAMCAALASLMFVNKGVRNILITKPQEDVKAAKEEETGEQAHSENESQEAQPVDEAPVSISEGANSDER